MEKVNVGIVGLGRLGKKHAENIAYKIPNAQLLAACSIVKEEVEQIQRDWGIKYVYTNFDDMLKNKELDAIFIASPSSFHCEQIAKALEAGFHVFSEKPLGLYVDEVKSVQKVVNEHNDQIFMLGFMRRYDKSYAYAKQKIEEGIIGEPILIRCYGIDPASAMEGFIKFAKSNYSGGLFLDMAIHDFDLARWFLNSEALKVWAIGGVYAHPVIKEINDVETGAALVQFENNKMGIFVSGRNCIHGYHVETEIIGTNGTIRIGSVPEKNLVTIFDNNGARKECVGGFLERFDQAYLSEVKEFINCIVQNKKPSVKVEDGVKSTIIAYACKKSYETGELVNIEQ